ncbi:RNA polymerase II-associated [Biscogniauxia mediterranea]|nr:RNA polymerase II-associated [Biscogniauxia mediterranea]
MASSSRSSEHRSVHQDFIARIRYSNALPPPPNPPKLLDIPNTGLASGQYTAPGFASRLAREQPLNIEADAELGMPLDLVGMPGIFDGDESSIQAPAQPPTLHPHDRALLRPLQTLGKPKVSEPNVSFLRRTEYISSTTSKGKHEAGPLRTLNPNPLKRPVKRPSPEPDKDSPAYLKRKIDQGFAIAAANLKDKSRVRHPSKRNVKLVDAFPLVPDLEAFPDAGAYVTLKFTNNPVPPSRTYDTRLLSALFRPAEKSKEEEDAYEAALQAYHRDPINNPKPPSSTNYDYFLTDSVETAERFRKRFDVENTDHDDDSLYTKGGARPCFEFPRVRGYETAQEVELDHATKYDEELLITFSSDEMVDQKAAYYYPVMQRSTIRPQRTKNIARTIGIGYGGADEEVLDQLDVTVEDPNENLRRQIARYRDEPFGFQTEEDLEQQQQQQHEQDAGQETNGHARHQAAEDSDDEDQDAEGDEED